MIQENDIIVFESFRLIFQQNKKKDHILSIFCFQKIKKSIII